MYIENNNRLKKLIEYIEENLTEKLEYKDLAKILLENVLFAQVILLDIQ